MANHTFRILALSSVALMMAGAALAQQPAARQKTTPGIPGFFNPMTHTFTARVARAQVSPDATTTTYGGTLKFEFTVKLDTAIVSGEDLLCYAAADIFDANDDGFEYEEGASSIAKVSGSTATCTVLIPYSWGLQDASADEVDVAYTLETVPTSTSSPYIYYAAREHDSSLPAIKVPANGATTAIVISATI